MNFGDRVRDALARSGRSRKDLAAAIGISVQAVGDVINGKTKAFTAENNAIAASFLEVDPYWLATGLDPLQAHTHASHSVREPAPSWTVNTKQEGLVMVRRIEAQIANGHGLTARVLDDHPPIAFHTDFLLRLGISAKDAVIVEADGSSNAPTIPDSAIVLVNSGDKEVLTGELFAFRHGAELLIRRLEKIEGVGILATSDNPEFRPKSTIYPAAADLEVIGRAVWVGIQL